MTIRKKSVKFYILNAALIIIMLLLWIYSIYKLRNPSMCEQKALALSNDLEARTRGFFGDCMVRLKTPWIPIEEYKRVEKQ